MRIQKFTDLLSPKNHLKTVFLYGNKSEIISFRRNRLIESRKLVDLSVRSKHIESPSQIEDMEMGFFGQKTESYVYVWEGVGDKNLNDFNSLTHKVDLITSSTKLTSKSKLLTSLMSAPDVAVVPCYDLFPQEVAFCLSRSLGQHFESLTPEQKQRVVTFLKTAPEQYESFVQKLILFLESEGVLNLDDLLFETAETDYMSLTRAFLEGTPDAFIKEAHLFTEDSGEIALCRILEGEVVRALKNGPHKRTALLKKLILLERELKWRFPLPDFYAIHELVFVKP